MLIFNLMQRRTSRIPVAHGHEPYWKVVEPYYWIAYCRIVLVLGVVPDEDLVQERLAYEEVTAAQLGQTHLELVHEEVRPRNEAGWNFAYEKFC